jgi:hypothetical protein
MWAYPVENMRLLTLLDVAGIDVTLVAGQIITHGMYGNSGTP